MEEQTKPKKWEKLKAPYRLVVMNHETFEEIGSYRLTLLNLYIGLCILLFLGGATVLALILFTPIKEWIPGYQDITHNSEFIKIEKRLRDMESELAAYQLYTKKLSNFVSADPDATDLDAPIPETTILEPKPHNISMNEEERQLRERMESTGIAKATDFLNNPTTSKISLSQIYFIPPVSGTISAGFMIDQKHYGVDVLAPKNTPVKAALAGYVISSDWTLETGHTLAIQHDHHLITFYKHNSQLLKKTGDRVNAGEAVAIIGNTGTLSDGPHLHFELWHDGQPLDPALYIHF